MDQRALTAWDGIYLGTGQGAVVSGLMLIIGTVFAPSFPAMLMLYFFGIAHLVVGSAIWWTANQFEFRIQPRQNADY